MKTVALSLAVLVAGGVFGYYKLPRHESQQTVAAVNHAPRPRIVEVKVGEFMCTNNRAERDIHVTFELYAVVHTDQQFEFRDRVQRSENALIRQEIIRIIRSSDVDALNDPELRLLRKRARGAINKLLGRSVVRDVVFSDYTMMRQF